MKWTKPPEDFFFFLRKKILDTDTSSSEKHPFQAGNEASLISHKSNSFFLHWGFLFVQICCDSLLALLSLPLRCFFLSLCCLGPLGLGSYQLVMGPGESALAPEHRLTGWPHISTQDSVFPFPPLHTAGLSKLVQTEKNVGREQIWTWNTKTHLQTGTRALKGYISKILPSTYWSLIKLLV